MQSILLYQFSWFLDTAVVYSPLIFIQLVCCMLLTASTLFSLDLVSSTKPKSIRRLIKKNFNSQQMKHFDSTIFSLLVSFACGISSLTVYCYCGSMSTGYFEDMAVYIYDSNWYEHPTNLQKYAMIMIQNMQIPLYYTGFDVAYLNLETFERVSENTWSLCGG